MAFSFKGLATGAFNSLAQQQDEARLENKENRAVAFDFFVNKAVPAFTANKAKAAKARTMFNILKDQFGEKEAATAVTALDVNANDFFQQARSFISETFATPTRQGTEQTSNELSGIGVPGSSGQQVSPDPVSPSSGSTDTSSLAVPGATSENAPNSFGSFSNSGNFFNRSIIGRRPANEIFDSVASTVAEQFNIPATNAGEFLQAAFIPEDPFAALATQPGGTAFKPVLSEEQKTIMFLGMKSIFDERRNVSNPDSIDAVAKAYLSRDPSTFFETFSKLKFTASGSGSSFQELLVDEKLRNVMLQQGSDAAQNLALTLEAGTNVAALAQGGVFGSVEEGAATSDLPETRGGQDVRKILKTPTTVQKPKVNDKPRQTLEEFISSTTIDSEAKISRLERIKSQLVEQMSTANAAGLSQLTKQQKDFFKGELEKIQSAIDKLSEE